MKKIISTLLAIEAAVLLSGCSEQTSSEHRTDRHKDRIIETTEERSGSSNSSEDDEGSYAETGIAMPWGDIADWSEKLESSAEFTQEVSDSSETECSDIETEEYKFDLSDVDNIDWNDVPEMSEKYFKYEVTDGELCITDYYGTNPIVKIPKTIDGATVTSIGDWAFRRKDGFFQNQVICVSIPDSVTKLGEGSFFGRSELKNVNIPDSVTDIGNSAFGECSGLIEITIPNSVTNIGDRAFMACTGLTYVSIPDSVVNIGDSAFMKCTGLTGVYIPDSVKSIERGAFYECTGLTDVTLPDSITEIEGYVFNNCTGLLHVHIPDSVTEIGFEAFGGCTSLTSVKLPDSVKKISFSFSDCPNVEVEYRGNKYSSAMMHTLRKEINGK